MANYTEEEILAGLITHPAIWEKEAYLYYYERVKAFTLKEQKDQFNDEWFTDAYADMMIAFSRNVRNGSFQRKSEPFTYLVGIFKHKYIDQIRIANRNGMIVDVSQEPHPISEQPNPLQRHIHRDDVNVMKEALKRLGKNCLELIMGYHHFGYSFDELAEQLDYKNAATVRKRKHQCSKQLKEMIDPLKFA